MKSILTVRSCLIALLFVSTFVPKLTYSQGDECSGALQIFSSSTPCSFGGNGTYSLSGATASAVPAGCASPGTHRDIWFYFVATATTHAITLGNIGSNILNAEIQLYSGTCAALVSMQCSNAPAGNPTLTATGLTIGNTYYVRVSHIGGTLSGGSPSNKLDVCLTGPSANDDCAGAVTLTPASTCSNTAGNLYLASATTGLPVGCESAGIHYDIWYKFTATQATHTVSISSLGTSLTNPEIQLYSGTCAGLTSLACGATSITTNGLTTGNTYYVRVSNMGSSITSNGSFNICVVSPVVSDDCSGAVLLTSNSTCITTSSTLIGATASAGIPAGCASAGTHYDVWFKFVASSPLETITFTKVTPSNISNPELQLFSGACGSLTSIQCGTTSIAATGLAVGTTYYVRVSQVGGSSLATRGDFTICVRHSVATPSNIDFSKSYVNITKGTGGGTVNPGDILEIRATLVVRSGASSSVDSLALYDTLAATEGLRLVPGSLALRTNEGKLYKSFTDIYDGDAAWRQESINNIADTVIQINFGAGASNTSRGALSNTSKPSVFGNTCIIMATYRVVVTAPYNTLVNVGGGELTIRDKNTGSYSDLIFKPTNVMVYQSPGLCPNAVSASNAIGGDFNGTFGTPSSGAPLTKNRGTSPNVPGYIYANFTTGSPQDYYYGITNNTSGSGASFSTITTWAKPDNSSPTHRVFNVWDITGDHTGAINPTKGNPPCDTTQPVSPTNPCGYMLVINSAYKTDTGFQYTVNNLCPNTYYEISSWIKNICYKCSCDSNGVGASGAGYIPFAANDSSGVQPNLAFEINGIDYYTTGNIAYAGVYPTTQRGSDSTNVWVKRGFTYQTSGSQTSLTLTIRNNAPGGGGNDWALDDITLATCLPNMQYSPMLNPTTCQNNPYDIRDTLRSYFNIYNDYKWQRSTDGGSTWTDVTSPSSASPSWNGSAWEYVAYYTVPPANAAIANSGDLYRVVAATTPTNLGNTSCLFTDGVSIITMTFMDCGVPLKTDLLSFNGKLIANNANLSWVTSKENEPVYFNIERSSDGINFKTIGTINGFKNYSAENNYYTFTDPLATTGKVWYRLVMVNDMNMKKYSRIIQLSDQRLEFGLSNVINPFNHELDFDVTVSESSRIEAILTSLSGKTLRRESFIAYEGVNSLTINDTDRLPPGMYILQIKSNGNMISKKLIKK